jgi:hypothetical protein
VQIYEMHRSAPVPAVVPTKGPIPAWHEAAVSKALANNPQERHATASAIRTALEAVVFVPKPKLVADPPPRKTSKPKVAGFLRIFAAIAAFAVLGVLVYAQLQKGPQAPERRVPEAAIKTADEGRPVTDAQIKPPVKAQEGIKVPPPPPPVMASVEQGCELYTQGRTTDAIATLTRALSAKPDDAEGLYCLCGAYVRQPDTKAEAQKTCKAYRDHPKREAGKTTQVDIWLRRVR